MSKFSLKSEHFTTPIKLVLPGIIVSLIGASAGYYIFNNPEKTRAKATYETWKVINQFEVMFDKNSDILPCNTPQGDQLQIQKDYIHLYEMTRQNLEDLKSEEKIDKRLSAILNMKIDSYNELKRITGIFLDTAQVINSAAARGELTTAQQNYIIGQIQLKYLTDVRHISNRDTTMISNIIKELNQTYSSYVDSFLVVNRVEVQDTAEMKPFIPGKWITADKVKITYDKAGKGNWDQDSIVFNFSWDLKKEVLTMKNDENGREIVFHLIKINEALMSFVLTDRTENAIIVNACRIQ